MAAQKFTEDQLKAFRVQFDDIDADKSGVIDAKELGVLLGRLGEDNSEAKAKSLISALDSRGSKGKDGISDFKDTPR